MGKFLDNPLLLIILVVIVVLVFGANRLPGAARSLGRSMRIFKSEVKQMKDEDEPGAATGSRSARSTADAPIEGRVVDEAGARRAEDVRSTPDDRSARDGTGKDL